MKYIIKYVTFIILFGFAVLVIGGATDRKPHNPTLTKEMEDGLKTITPNPEWWFRQFDKYVCYSYKQPMQPINSDDYHLFGGSVNRAVKDAKDALVIAYYYLDSYANISKHSSFAASKSYYIVKYYTDRNIYDVQFYALGGEGIEIDAATGNPLYRYTVSDEQPEDVEIDD